MKRPKAPAVAAMGAAKGRSGLMVVTSCCAHMSVKLAAMASWLRPTRMPSTISAKSDSVLAEVKVFWISLPRWMPRVLIQVMKRISSTATSCCIERLTAYP